MKLMARYLTREIAGGIMAVLLGFLGLFAFFDLINELDDIGQGGYRLPQAVLYVLLGGKVNAQHFQAMKECRAI